MNIYVDGVLTPPADAGSLDGIPAALQPVGPGVDGYVVTYVDATGDLELQPGGGGGMANPMTATGNLIVGGAVSGGIATPMPFAIGTGGYVLRSVAGNPAWRELSAAGLLSPGRQPAAAVREGQTYWATDAAAGQQLSICLHKGSAVYAWETLAYDLPAAPAASLGTAFDNGFLFNQYLDVAGIPSAAPLFGPGESLVYLFKAVKVPLGTEIMVCHTDSGSGLRGWEVRCGDFGSQGNLSLYLLGLGVQFLLPGADFTSAPNSPHVLAVAITAGQVVRYSWDGVLQTPLAALTGTYSPPISGDPYLVGGRPANANYPSVSTQLVQLRSYSSVLSDADLVAVAATYLSYSLSDPAAGTLTGDFPASSIVGYQTTLDRADPARRWRVNGSVLAQGQK